MDPVPCSSKQAAHLHEQSEVTSQSNQLQNNQGSNVRAKMNMDNDASDVLKLEKDASQLLKIFPEEIWGLVLDELQDPADIESACNATLFFREILLSKRVVFLFPKVLEILDFKNHLNFPEDRYRESPPFSEDSDDEIDGVPFKDYYEFCNFCRRWTPRWWRTSMLTFRVVCWTWSQAVDQTLQRFPSRLNASRNHGEKSICTSRNTTLRFMDWDDSDGPAQFLEDFESSDPSIQGRNPFINRRVWIELDGHGENEAKALPPIPDGIFRLLQKFGEHVWYCHLILCPPLLKCYYALHTALGFLPNLKVLELEYVPQAYEPTLEEIKELNSEIINGYHLPTLDNLTAISMWSLPYPIMNELIHRNSQVSALELCPEIDDEEFSNIDATPLPKLRQLDIRYENALHFQRQRWAAVDWSLTKIEVDLVSTNDFIEWSLIFSWLEKFAETLTSLVLITSKPKKEEDRIRILEECSTLKLRLPRVVYLELKMKTVSSLDFVLPMSESLEFLNVTLVFDVDKEQKMKVLEDLESGQVIKFLSVSDRLLESNVWTLFPKLKCVKYAEACGKDVLEDQWPGVRVPGYTFASYKRPNL